MKTIEVENLSKRYILGGKRSGSIRDTITNIFNGSQSTSPKNELWALNDVNFEVKSGETLGVIGRNGAGKSTLLKILSRITKPTSGSAKIHGRVGSLLEVGTGFHNELSGRENIYLNGAILGMRRSEIEKKFDEIVEFSEIEKFLDTPVKHYSSGMYLRLAFSIAAHLEPEVLIDDEVLAVGDMEFQNKCLGKMDEVSRSGRTVLFVSHNLGSLAQICRTGLLLHQGKVVSHGTIENAISNYLSFAKPEKQFKLADSGMIREMAVTEAYLANADGETISEIPHDQDFWLELKLTVQKMRRGALFCVALLNKYNDRVFTEHKQIDGLFDGESGTAHLRFAIPKKFIAPNNYSFLVQIFLPSGELIQDLTDICPFTVFDSGSELSAYNDYGYVQFVGNWEIVE